MISHPTLDQRVTALEQEVARLTKLERDAHDHREKDWRSTIGMFRGDAIMKQVIDEGRRIREHDREHPGE